MKKLLVSMVFVVLVGSVVYVYHEADGDEDHAKVQQLAASTGPVTQVVKALGILQPLRTVQVGAQVSGVVTALHADFNSVVRKGQVIAELDPSLFQIQVAVQQANIAKTDSSIAAQKYQLQEDRRNLERAESEFAKGVVSAQDRDTARLKARTQAALVDSMEKMRVQAEAQLRQAQLNVSYCTIRSPIDGVIVNRYVDVGQTVQARMNTPQFFTIASDLTTIRIAAAVDEADIASIRPQLPVTFTVETYKGRRFTGRIAAVRLNAITTNNVVTYPVWIAAPNPDLALRPSMTATLEIPVGTARNAVRVPNEALRFRPSAQMFEWLGVPSPTGLHPLRIQAPEPTKPDAAPPPAPPSRGQIDAYFAPAPKRITPAQVWVYEQEDAGMTLRPIVVRTGLSDGAWTEVVSGNVRPGEQFVVGVTPPPSALEPRRGLFEGPQRYQRGGMRQVEPQLPTLRRPSRRG